MTDLVESDPPRSGLSHRDPTLPLDHRVEALLRCLTLDEKSAMLHRHAPAVPSLGVAAFRTGTDVSHGAARLGPATVFPQAVGLGATWNPDLLHAVGRAVGAEVEAFHRADPAVGRNVWTPVANLLHDPRRQGNEEGYSEDPVLTAALAVAYCTGLRGPDDGPWVTAPALMSFPVRGDEDGASSTSAQIRPRVFWEYAARPFLDAVRAGAVSGVVASRAHVNGRPSYVGPWFGVLRDIAPDLLVLTGPSGPPGPAGAAGHFPDRAQAVAAAVRAGVDGFADHDGDTAPAPDAIRAALDRGLLHEAEVDAAVRRLLRMRLRLGEFDGPPGPGHGPGLGSRPGQGPGPTVEELRTSDEHRTLARRAAREAVVLLKNAAVGGTALLPVGEDVTRVAVIGPLADEVCADAISGALPYRSTIADAVRDRWPGAKVTFTDGADRIAVRVRGHGYLTSQHGADPGPLRTGTVKAPGPEHLFDRIEWGQGVVSLRSAAGGRPLSARASDGVLVAGASRQPGDVLHETFAIGRHDDAFVLSAAATGRYLAPPGPDGTPRFDADGPGAAAHLTVEVHRDGIGRAASAAAGADIAILTLGSRPHAGGGEGGDRPGLALPGRQEQTARAVLAAQPRTVGIIVSGRPFAVPWLAEHVPALLWTCHGGQELGRAVVDVLCGDHSPAGRLPQTWYRDEADLPARADHDIITTGQTYLYSDAVPLFPFGHGLGYSEFRYSSLRVARTGDAISVACSVANTGGRAAEEVVQLYARAIAPAVPRPARELKGFRRVRVRAGEVAEVAFTLGQADLSVWNPGSGAYEVPPGRYEFLVGASSEDVRLTGSLDVAGTAGGPRRLDTRLVRAADFDDHRATRLVAETAVGGDAVEAEAGGAWLSFRSCALPSGAATAVARVAADESGTVVIRLADPHDGPVVAEAAVAGDGQWHTVQVPATVPAGGHDVYIVLSKGVRIATFMVKGQRA